MLGGVKMAYGDGQAAPCMGRCMALVHGGGVVMFGGGGVVMFGGLGKIVNFPTPTSPPPPPPPMHHPCTDPACLSPNQNFNPAQHVPNRTTRYCC